MQGLSNKIDEVELLLTELQIDILCISEHWLCNDNVKNISFSDYNIMTYFSRSTSIHGGSLILVKSNIKSNEILSIGRLSVESHVELCAISFFMGKTKFINITLYRPPTGDINIFIFNLTEALNIAAKISDYIVLCGDFNIDYNKNCLYTTMLCDVFNSFALNVSLTEPTRVVTNVNGRTSSSCIDYITTNLPLNSFYCYLVNPNIADHFGHLLCIKNYFSESLNINNDSNIFYRRTINENNLVQLSSKLMSIDWSNLYDLNIPEAFNYFIETLIWYLNIYCPVKKVSVSSGQKRNKWITNEIIQLSTQLKDLHWIMINLNSNEVKTLYREEKKTFKYKIKEAKHKYYNDQIINSSNKTKKTWSIINNNLGRSNRNSNTPVVLNYNNNIITNESEVVSIFGSFFSTAASDKIYDHFGCNLSLPCTLSGYNPQSIYFAPVSLEEVNDVIDSLKNKNSAGFDGLTSNIIKNIKDSILVHFVYLINKSVIHGQFPNILKLASVIPIFKKGCPKDVENYRQISVLSSLSKIMEKIVYNRIASYTESKNMITESQHGFRSNKSIETASFHLLEYVYKHLDQGQYVVSLFLDLSKAFDTVDKDILEKKLSHLGIRGNIQSWLISFMSDRSLVVKLQESNSEVYDVLLGVPQGSVLGPLLFMLFVNDLPHHISHGRVTMFADDTTITVASKCLEELQQKVATIIDEVNSWCQRNRLILNNDKTVCLNFNIHKPIPHNLTFNNNLNISDSTKFLGTHLDPQLTWTLHTDHVCNKLNSAYFAILQMKSSLDVNGLLNIYYALAYSHMSLNILSWGSTKEIERIFINQKRIIRLIFGMKFRESCRDVFKEKGILTLPSIYILKCLTFVKQNLHIFQKSNENHSYNTRHGDLLSIPKHRTTTFKLSPLYNCIILYNSLPNEIKCITRYENFKKAVKQFLLVNAFYTVTEYINREAY